MGTQPRNKPRRLGAKLLAIRSKALGLSQSQLARQLCLTTGPARISEWERDKREPDMIVLLNYARLARVDLEMIVDDEMELIIPESKKRVVTDSER